MALEAWEVEVVDMLMESGVSFEIPRDLIELAVHQGELAIGQESKARIELHFAQSGWTVINDDSAHMLIRKKGVDQLDRGLMYVEDEPGLFFFGLYDMSE